MSDWVHLRTEPNPIVASLVEGRLKTEGIPVITKGNPLGTSYPTNTGGTAETYIYVPRSRLKEAQNLLESLEQE